MLNIASSRFIKSPVRNRHSLLQKILEFIYLNKLSVCTLIQTLFIAEKLFVAPKAAARKLRGSIPN